VLGVLALDLEVVVDELRPRAVAVVGLPRLVDAPQPPAAASTSVGSLVLASTATGRSHTAIAASSSLVQAIVSSSRASSVRSSTSSANAPAACSRASVSTTVDSALIASNTATFASSRHRRA
jgi:hypothetical protein